MNETLHVDLLGRVSATIGGRVVAKFRTHKTAALLAYLAFHLDHPHQREALAEAIWPESEPEAGRANLRVALNALRKELEPNEKGAILIADRATIQLNPSRTSTDVARFETAFRQARAAESEGHYRAAIAVYRGPLAPSLHDEWIVAERDRLARLWLEACGRLTDLLSANQNWDEAIRFATIVANEEPYDEPAQERLIRLLKSRGRLAEAGERFEEYKKRLLEELSVQPSPALLALGEALPKARAKSAKQEPAGRIPLHLTRFYGREAEKAALLQRDPTARIVTLTGPGGSGKTRLACEVAQEFHGRARFVDLSGVTDPEDVPGTIAQALGVAGARLEDVAATLGASLLILDNVEQLVADDSPGLVGETICALLQFAPELSCLVTSRTRVGVAGEREIRLGPLASKPSVEMMLDRLRLANPSFELDATNASLVDSLARRLEGIPLSIELAAAWADVLSLAEIDDRLSLNPGRLEARRRATPERHRSLQAAIAWSFDLLSPDLRAFLTTLAAFRGGWSLAAANEVSGDSGALRRLADLKDRSLVEASETALGVRFRLLESVREFVWESLPPDLASDLRNRHASFFEKLANEARSHLRGPNQAEWLPRLAADEDNLRASLDWLLRTSPDRAGALMRDLARYWEAAGRDGEALRWLARLPLRDVEDPALRVALSVAQARFFVGGGAEHERAAPLVEEALAISRKIGREDLEADATYIQAHLSFQRSHHDHAIELFERVLVLAERVGNRSRMGDCLINLGDLEIRRGQLDQAERRLKRGLELSQEAGDLRNVAMLYDHLAWVAWSRARYDEASRLVRKTLETAREIGDRHTENSALMDGGRLALVLGDARGARLLFEEAHTLGREFQIPFQNRHAEWCLADLTRREGDLIGAETAFEKLLSKTPKGDQWELMCQFGLVRVAFDRRDAPAMAALLAPIVRRAPIQRPPWDALLIMEACAYAIGALGKPAEARRLLDSLEFVRATKGPVRDPIDVDLAQAARGVAGPDKREAPITDLDELARVCEECLTGAKSEPA
jgi:predicted ATPase/DNA-binding SARP family transcriptional activator